LKAKSVPLKGTRDKIATGGLTILTPHGIGIGTITGALLARQNLRMLDEQMLSATGTSTSLT